MGCTQKVSWILVWVNLQHIHQQQPLNLHPYNSQAGCSKSLLGSQPGQLQFLAILPSRQNYYWCRCLIEGVLARVYAWQLRHSPSDHSCSGMGCVRSCPIGPHKPLRGIQLWSAHPGLNAGQLVGHLHDHGRLASGPADGSNPGFGHYWTVGWNPGVTTVETDWSFWP